VIWQRELATGAALAGVIILILVAAELWRRLGSPRPELTRKLIHTSTGVITLTFPFLLRSAWTVLALTSSFALLVWSGKRLGFLKSLHGIERESQGARLYPLAVFILFMATRGRPWLYVASMLVLGVSDALAAVVGSRYGTRHFEIGDAKRSLEGSLVFLVVAFLVIHLPLLLMTGLPRESTVLVALLAAAMATAVEAVSVRGTDNLFVPLIVYIVLDRLAGLPPGDLVALNLGALFLGVVLTFVMNRARGFNAGGIIGLVLFTVAVWTFGPASWALPFFLGLAAYLPLWFLPPRIGSVPAAVVLEALLPAFAVLAASAGFRNAGFFHGPYMATISLLTALCIVGRFQRKWGKKWWSRPAVGLAAAVPAWLLAAFVPWVVQGGAPLAPLLFVGALTAAGALAASSFVDREEPPEHVVVWPRSLLAIQFAVTSVSVAVQLTGLIPLWRPVY